MCPNGRNYVQSAKQKHTVFNYFLTVIIKMTLRQLSECLWQHVDVLLYKLALLIIKCSDLDFYFYCDAVSVEWNKLWLLSYRS